ncbi:MAG: poly(3-hydroxybutyrate) depolymerase [Actinobacteria bacterium]|nr:poly(3-hydroxybutyrate) depolymerase [Actinomycetota bacterium]
MTRIAPPRPTAWVASAVVVLAAASCGGAEAVPAATTSTVVEVSPASPLVVGGPGRYEVNLVSGGLERRFHLVVPGSIAKPAPLVVVLHGFTRSGAEIDRTSGMSALAVEEGFVAAYPDGTGIPRRWISSPLLGDLDVVFFRDLVKVVSGAVDIDPRRVYVAGFSNGGGMAARLACDAADLVAAVGPVAAAYPGGPCDPARPVPVLAIHGTADPIVPYEGLGEVLPAVEGVVAGWVARNGCAPAPTVEGVAPEVTRASWAGCGAGADVLLYRVEGGRHGWPGSSDRTPWGKTTDAIDAAALLWEFFAAHPMP